MPIGDLEKLTPVYLPISHWIDVLVMAYGVEEATTGDEQRRAKEIIHAIETQTGLSPEDFPEEWGFSEH